MIKEQALTMKLAPRTTKAKRGTQPSQIAGTARSLASWLAFCLTLAMSLSMAAVLTAQPAEAPPTVFVDQVDVNVVNVEVFVTEKDGTRVTDLTMDDFEIFEDGQPVEVTNFYRAQRPDRVVGSLERDRQMVLNRGEPVEAPPQIRDDQRLHLVVYIDSQNLLPLNRRRILDELDSFLEDRVRQGDRAMVVSYGTSVDVVQPFTEDMGLLTRAIERVAKQNTYGQTRDAQRRRVMRAIEDPGGDQITPGLQEDLAFSQIKSYVQQVNAGIRDSAAAFARVMQSLGGLPGRKAVLYVSDGLSKRPAEEFLDPFNRRFGAGSLESLPGGTSILSEDNSALIDVISREANANEVTIYTLHATPPGKNESLSASYAPVALSANETEVGARSTRLLNLQESMVDLAEDTGGEAILNTANYIGALTEVSRDFDSLYSLGYRPRRGGDDQYHELEVRVVGRPGLKVRHRSGFVDKTASQRAADRTLSSLLLDFESNPMGLTVEFGEAKKVGRKKFELPFLVRMPIGAMTLLPSEGQEVGRLRIFVGAKNDEGEFSPLQEIPYPVTIPADKAEEAKLQQLGYANKLLVRQGLPKVAIGVWDEIGGTQSFVYHRVQVGEVKKGKKKNKKR